MKKGLCEGSSPIREIGTRRKTFRGSSIGSYRVKRRDAPESLGQASAFSIVKSIVDAFRNDSVERNAGKERPLRFSSPENLTNHLSGRNMNSGDFRRASATSPRLQSHRRRTGDASVINAENAPWDVLPPMP